MTGSLSTVWNMCSSHDRFHNGVQCEQGRQGQSESCCNGHVGERSLPASAGTSEAVWEIRAGSPGQPRYLKDLSSNMREGPSCFILHTSQEIDQLPLPEKRSDPRYFLASTQKSDHYRGQQSIDECKFGNSGQSASDHRAESVAHRPERPSAPTRAESAGAGGSQATHPVSAHRPPRPERLHPSGGSQRSEQVGKSTNG